METVNIFTIVDGLDDFLLINMLGQGQLHNEAIHITVAIQTVYACQQLLFCHILFIADECRLEATGLTSQHFVLDIGL